MEKLERYQAQYAKVDNCVVQYQKMQEEIEDELIQISRPEGGFSEDQLSKLNHMNAELKSIKTVLKIQLKKKRQLKEKLRKWAHIVEKVRESLRGVNVDGQNKLHIAIRAQKTEEAIQLIRDGINLYELDRNCRTPFNYAVQQSNFRVMNEMLHQGYDLKFNACGTSILGEPMSLEMAKYLVGQGEPVSSELTFVVQNGADPKSADLFSLFFFGISRDRFGRGDQDRLELNVANFKKLVDLGADPNVGNFWHWVAHLKVPSCTEYPGEGRNKPAHQKDCELCREGLQKVSTPELDHVVEVIRYAAAAGLFSNHIDPGKSSTTRGMTPLQIAEEYVKNPYPFEGNSAASHYLLDTIRAALETDCGICLEFVPYSVEKKSFCGTHGFHTQCLENWYRQSQSCPLCRARRT